MQSEIRNTEQWGKVLWLQNAGVEIGVALDFGIRIVHLSCEGMENLYYVQPNDLSDNFVQQNGWRVYGGHRLWLAPECADSYCPSEQAPIRYTVLENGVILQQDTEPLLQISKRLQITFLEDGNVALDHEITNCSDKTITGASWGVNTLDGGGQAKIAFPGQRGFNPKRVVSVWGLTNLHDPRIQFEKDSVTATHMAEVTDYFKIGLYANPGEAVLKNKGQELTITFDAQPLECYMDNGCNFELYLCSRFMELETLGTRTVMQPGESASHREVWHLKKL
ncbi:MAG: hypothetical protein IKU57_04250 [Oscillospiraceae bacterium]|nr:hypothetical protein [Oscillospiraceae bacterium]